MTSKKAVSTKVADILRKQILQGDWMPGQRLRQEIIAQELNVSRIPVRDALRILEADGLVSLQTNQGAWISALSMQECLEQYEIRERLEPLLIRASIPGFTKVLVEKLEQIASSMEGISDVNLFTVVDREFHMLTYSAAPDGALKALIERLWNTTQHYRRSFAELIGPPGLSTTHLEHRLLIDAIKRRDSESAEQLIASHIRRTKLALARQPQLFEIKSL